MRSRTLGHSLRVNSYHTLDLVRNLKDDTQYISMSAGKSLYDVLGVPKQSSQTDIRKAYLKLARVHHPDKGGDPEKFKEITHASDVLTDEKRRRLYDDTGLTDENAVNMPQGFPGFPPGFPGGPGGMPFEFNMNDLFGNMFNGQRNTVRKGRKPPPIQQNIGITLEQFYLGHQFEIHPSFLKMLRQQ